ncbi:hypothetical protein BDV97DRAFT_349722 [Delphinella strobiligena]|nr:hypothetical protein BDV97DRAFT_349722 [Delphinella strobiligena]
MTRHRNWSRTGRIHHDASSTCILFISHLAGSSTRTCIGAVTNTSYFQKLHTYDP